MELTPYHSKYYAFELTRKLPSDSDEKFASAIVNAQVDLNPHQVDAALFAFRSPFSRGAILADEVGLGKTIEAGLVISQYWAERKRRILIITPSNLRKQWHQELAEKFFIDCSILESKSYKQSVKDGDKSPFIQNTIVICSYQFARNKSEEISSIPWDLVVIDEAHRLRNVYKTSNKIAKAIKASLIQRNKLLLTATPLQNSLLELYGLVSIIDDHIFGDVQSFRDQFSNITASIAFDQLKARISPVCHRTLRRQVLPYIKYTKRHPIVRPYTPEESEDRLYNVMTEYLQRENIQALPASQRNLMTLVIRKLLSSSSFAIAGTFDSLIRRLQERLAVATINAESLLNDLSEDYETLSEIEDEWEEEETIQILSENEIDAIKNEIEDLKEYKKLALSIEHNAKGKELIVALDIAFAEAEKLGAEKKAIIFTESRRTQDYLLRVLSDSPYAEGIVLFNGSNNDDSSKKIYHEWLKKHTGTDKITGSKTADMRSALVDYFRETGRIMIATEAGAEGINLQFCSLVVNYDLPWNPQRIEQRIGRCHRYGQKSDVVVVNFLNQNNEADQRVFQLLDEKFQLFSGVFGSSDEVLGSIESGVDFERRIAEIYQKCRKTEEIDEAFRKLQAELDSQIDTALNQTRKQLLENFDDEVTEKLRVRDASSKEYLNKYETMLMDLTKHELKDNIEVINDSSFQLLNYSHNHNIPLGLYELPRRSGEAHLYRMNHPLAAEVLDIAKGRTLTPSFIEFNLSDRLGKITILNPYIGKTGIFRLYLLTVESLAQKEEYLLPIANDSDNQFLSIEAASRLLSISGKVTGENIQLPENSLFEEYTMKCEHEIIQKIRERNVRFYEEESEKLDGWADDLKEGLDREIKDLDKQIKETRRSSFTAVTLESKLDQQKLIKQLESTRNNKRRALFDAQDEIDRKRGEFITRIEGNLSINKERQMLFEIMWRIV